MGFVAQEALYVLLVKQLLSGQDQTNFQAKMWKNGFLWLR